MTKESMNFDVLIVGAGPSGLSASIKLAQLFIYSYANSLFISLLCKLANVQKKGA